MVNIVPEEKSKLRLSASGWWYHEEEPFENDKVIEFFHKAIRKDKGGKYYLYNKYADKEENVYFQVEDTAYFIEVIKFDQGQQAFNLTLNTGAREVLDVHSLEEDDRGVMYCRVLDNDRARLTPRALSQLSEYVVMDGDLIYLDKTGEKVILSKD